MDVKGIDLAEIRDAYTITAAISLESIGFAEKGKPLNYWVRVSLDPETSLRLIPSAV